MKINKPVLLLVAGLATLVVIIFVGSVMRSQVAPEPQYTFPTETKTSTPNAEVEIDPNGYELRIQRTGIASLSSDGDIQITFDFIEPTEGEKPAMAVMSLASLSNKLAGKLDNATLRMKIGDQITEPLVGKFELVQLDVAEPQEGRAVNGTALIRFWPSSKIAPSQKLPVWGDR